MHMNEARHNIQCSLVDLILVDLNVRGKANIAYKNVANNFGLRATYKNP